MSLYFMAVPEPKSVKNRLHLDVITEGSMEVEVLRSPDGRSAETASRSTCAVRINVGTGLVALW